MSANKWAEIILKSKNEKSEKVDPEWKTRLQLQKELNYSESYTLEIIKNLINQNRIEMRKFRIPTSRGVYPTQHYRIIKK